MISNLLENILSLAAFDRAEPRPEHRDYRLGLVKPMSQILPLRTPVGSLGAIVVRAVDLPETDGVSESLQDLRISLGHSGLQG
jgi:hypothetical protein